MKTMKQCVAVILMLCLLVSSSFCSLTAYAAGAETDYSIAAMEGYYKTQGRVYRTGSRLYTDWSASGIEFYAECSGDVYVTFQVDSVNTQYYGGCYFTVLVDGAEKGRGLCCLKQTGEQRVKIASGLSAGAHRFELYRQTEIGASVSINGVSLTGSLLKAPKKNDMYIEFVGDSITVAYGNLASSGTENSGAALYTNAMQGYAYMTAHNKLGADFSLVAVQGIGASVGWQSYTMQDMYPKLRYPRDNHTAYDFARQPDVVVLALGTNDMNRYAAYNRTLEQVKQGFADTLAMVRQKNPNAKIVWIHGMMLSSSSSLIREVVKEAGGASAGIYELQLTQSNAGGNGHPNVAGHILFANDLSAFLKKLIAPAPTVQAQTDTSVTLKAQSGYEYSRDGKAWQSSPVFSDLTAGTYSFYQRKAETTDTAAGICSLAATVTVHGKAAVTTTTITAATNTTKAPVETTTLRKATTTASYGAMTAETTASTSANASGVSGSALSNTTVGVPMNEGVTTAEPAKPTGAEMFETVTTTMTTTATTSAVDRGIAIEMTQAADDTVANVTETDNSWQIVLICVAIAAVGTVVVVLIFRRRKQEVQ